MNIYTIIYWYTYKYLYNKFTLGGSERSGKTSFLGGLQSSRNVVPAVLSCPPSFLEPRELPKRRSIRAFVASKLPFAFPELRKLIPSQNPSDICCMLMRWTHTQKHCMNVRRTHTTRTPGQNPDDRWTPSYQTHTQNIHWHQTKIPLTTWCVYAIGYTRMRNLRTPENATALMPSQNPNSITLEFKINLPRACICTGRL